jgi:hypothetical protein
MRRLFFDSRTAVFRSRVAALQTGTVVVETKGYEDDDATVDAAGDVASAAGTGTGAGTGAGTGTATPRRCTVNRFRARSKRTAHLHNVRLTDVAMLERYMNVAVKKAMAKQREFL